MIQYDDALRVLHTKRLKVEGKVDTGTIRLSRQSKFFYSTEWVLVNVDHLFLLRILDIVNWIPGLLQLLLILLVTFVL